MIKTSLHGHNSRIKRSNPANEDEIRTELALAGYDLILPSTWKCHDQARIAVYVKSSIAYKVFKMKPDENDLPIVTLVLNSKEVISYTYREYTWGVSGFSDERTQVDRLNRILKHWEDLDGLF